MKEKSVNLFWGAVLILVGGWFLITRPDSFVIRDVYLGMAFNAGLSALFFISYFLQGKERWGWLFPACIFAGTTLTMLLTVIFPGLEGGWLAAPVFLGIAAPFLVRYLQDRQAHHWALFPVYGLTALALVVSFADVVHGELVGTLVLLAIALPFLFVYLTNRERRWALIPFGVLSAISIIPALTLLANDQWMPVMVLFVLAAPFVVVSLINRRAWWAQIPGGILLTIALVVLIMQLFLPDPEQEQLAQHIVAGALFLGFALTFLVLWLRRASLPTDWAIYPALVLALLSAVAFIAGEEGINNAWPVAVIAGGVLVLFRAFQRKAA